MSSSTVAATDGDLPAGGNVDAPPSRWVTGLAWLEAQIARLGDYMNPILVKETRQALKSRQFLLMFLLLLVFSWVITIGLIAFIGPGIYYQAAGSLLLVWYFGILTFALTVVVPFGAFRSLASEREENTYDLLRVSTLSARQIVNGKIASAAVQMGVYFSAVAPCIAFSYLLRGVDVVTVLVVLGYAAIVCLGLSMVALLAAASVQRKQGQVALSVLLIMGLLMMFFSGMGAVHAILEYSMFWNGEMGGLLMVAGFLSLGATTFLLAYLATIGLISYRTENRSSPLRWAMLVQQGVYYDWIAGAVLTMATEFGVVGGLADKIFSTMFLVPATYWYFMGTMMTGESPELSHRVQRALPQSALGRWMLGWLNPGPGTGYFFAIANVTGAAVICSAGYALLQWLYPMGGMNSALSLEVYLLMVATWSYVAIFLGVGKLLLAGLRKFAPVTIATSLLVHVLLLLAASGIPYAIQMSSRSWRFAGYGPLQWSNPFWSIVEYLEHPGFYGDRLLHLLVVGAIALCVMLLNLPGAAREQLRGRIALPERVALDEAELHREEIKPQNPWEEEEMARQITDRGLQQNG